MCVAGALHVNVVIVSFPACFFVCLFTSSLPVLFRNVAKMEDAKVEIDDGKEELVVPDTTYQ